MLYAYLIYPSPKYQTQVSLSLSALKLKMKSRCILSLTIQNELWWFRKPHQTTHLLNHVKDTWKERERENSE